MVPKVRQIFDKVIVNRENNFADSDEESRFRNYSIFCLIGLPVMIVFDIYNLFVANFGLSLVIFTSYQFNRSRGRLVSALPTARFTSRISHQQSAVLYAAVVYGRHRRS